MAFDFMELGKKGLFAWLGVGAVAWLMSLLLKADITLGGLIANFSVMNLVWVLVSLVVIGFIMTFIDKQF